jgi:iron complex transport system substrate-binding protein
MNGCPRILTLSFYGALLLIWCGLVPFAQAAERQTQRIVSLAPSVTETLFALGFGPQVVGVTTYCDYPVEARKVPKVGSFMNPSIETIIAKRPDFVIGVTSATDPTKARQLERLGFKVTLISLASLNNILTSIKDIARLLGRAEAGAKLVNEITRQIEETKKRVAPAPRRSTLLAVGLQPLVAVGGKNYIDELITLAGGDNIAGNAAQPWLNLPDEYVVAKAPQVIIEAGMGSERGSSTKNWKDLKSIPAVRDGRVYSYQSDTILRPGPRIGEGLREIARLVHPECFVVSERGPNNESGCESSRP